MKRKTVKKILLYGTSIFVLMIVILAIHIYMVTRPSAPDAHTRIMARIDIKQDISQADAEKFTAWMYQQKGVDHVLCNAQSDILVFTFAPVATNADMVVRNFRSSFHVKAERFLPSEEDLKGGCPVGADSKTYKVYRFFKNIF